MSTAIIPVLVAGGGPVGLIAAYTLAHHGIPCMIVERNVSTTTWPKMDITNVRSMEILRRLGLSDELREQGVGQDHSFNVIISSGLGEEGEAIARWDLPSPNESRALISAKNDGSMPREPYQRCSQAIFEAWLKKKIEANSLIQCHWHTKLVDIQEKEDRVHVTLQDGSTGLNRLVEPQYVIGCDGGGSVVRKTLGLGLTGGPVPSAMYLVHFKSRDLDRLHRQGQFWHIFFTHGGVIIAQDENDTWTTHLPVPVAFDPSTLDPEEQIYRVLGGQGSPYKIKVDKVLVTSVWRPNNAIADHYRSAKGRVFIAGDAAHQNIPTGGYGMNTGLGDAYDIAWKLAMVLNGSGGEALLDSYEVERRPVAIRNVQRAAEHMAVHQYYVEKALTAGQECVLGSCRESQDLKGHIKEYVESHDGENRDLGIEMDYRLKDSPVIATKAGLSELEWTPQTYLPSTAPGSRAPHMFLADGITSVYDLFGEAYTVIDFSKRGDISTRLEQQSTKRKAPLIRLHLPDETAVREIWQSDVVVVRPDHFVAWQSDINTDYTDAHLSGILDKVFGWQLGLPEHAAKEKQLSFAGVEKVENQDVYKVDGLSVFQS